MFTQEDLDRKTELSFMIDSLEKQIEECENIINIMESEKININSVELSIQEKDSCSWHRVGVDRKYHRAILSMILSDNVHQLKLLQTEFAECNFNRGADDK